METQNPAQPLAPTPAASWAGGVKIEGQAVPLPSGNVALVKQISPQAFLSSGMIPNPLLSIIRKSIQDKQGMNPASMKKITEDNELLVSTLELFDRVLCHIMVEPVVEMPPPCKVCGKYANKSQHDPGVRDSHTYTEDARDPNILYADIVQMDDKVFLFQWALGGTADLESFREEQRQVVGDVPDSEDVQLPPE